MYLHPDQIHYQWRALRATLIELRSYPTFKVECICNCTIQCLKADFCCRKQLLPGFIFITFKPNKFLESVLIMQFRFLVF